jgi:apolipoprotein N-acyltransferase
VPLETKAGKAACLVCFDSIFPETARKQVNNGAEFIVVTTNDSWYKTSSAVYQHADHSVMRAIENNRPVIRSANTGVSMIITSGGFVSGKIDVNKRDVLYGSVFIPEGKTLYTRVGDVIVAVSAFVIAFFLVYGFIKNKKAFR